MEKHGFLSVALDASYTNLCDVLPHAQEIARLGSVQTIQGDDWRFLNRSLATDSQGRQLFVGWSFGDLYKEGSYGKIYRAYRIVVAKRADKRFDVVTQAHEVIVKQTVPPVGSRVLPSEDIIAHTSEGLLHVLAWRAMQTSLTPWAIPQPFEIFGDHSPSLPGWLSMSLCMSYVRGRTLYSYFAKYWTPTSRDANSKIFLHVMAQIAYILWNLQHSLRLNHRDVKVNNILIRPSKKPFRLQLPSTSPLDIVTHFELTLIDFGFACVGCPPPKKPMTEFQAGSWFSFGELCCKAGRDIAQLLFCIHCYFPLDVYLTDDLFAIVQKWMQIPWSGGIANALNGFTPEGRPQAAGGKLEYTKGIYEFLRRPEVDPTLCDPVTIFRECGRLLTSASV